jgi:hypothetical protein
MKKLLNDILFIPKKNKIKLNFFKIINRIYFMSKYDVFLDYVIPKLEIGSNNNKYLLNKNDILISKKYRKCRILRSFDNNLFVLEKDFVVFRLNKQYKKENTLEYIALIINKILREQKVPIKKILFYSFNLFSNYQLKYILQKRRELKRSLNHIEKRLNFYEKEEIKGRNTTSLFENKDS